MTDQQAVDFVQEQPHLMRDPQAASEALLKHSLHLHSMDNISVMVVRFCDNYGDNNIDNIGNVDDHDRKSE